MTSREPPISSPEHNGPASGQDSPVATGDGDRRAVQAGRVAARLLGERRRRRADSAEVFAAGQVVAGRYRILELLERGGEAQVYRAEDLELGQAVALKTLHPKLAASTAQLERFKQELLLARSVTHENVCRIFDWGRHRAVDGGVSDDPPADTDDVLFVTMELIDGETLSRWVERSGAIPLEHIGEIAVQVARGLRAAHERGVVHRDVKGQNVLIERGTSRAVLSDFGIAVSMADDSAAGAPLEGTPLTMAPEQIRGEAVDHRTDIYGFGVMLYHLVTGRWPFEASTALGTALQRLSEAPTSPMKWRPELPSDIETLMLRCLDPDREKRPESIDAVIEGLKPLSGDRGPTSIGGARTGATVVGWVSGLAACVLAIVLLGGWWLSTQRHRDRDPAPADPPVSSTTAERPAVLWLGIATEPTGSESAAWLAMMVEQGLTAAFTSAGDLRWVAGGRAMDIRRELGGSITGPLSIEAVRSSGRRAGVEYVLSGSSRLDSADGLQIELYLQQVGADKITPPVVGRVSPEDIAGFADVLTDTVAELRQSLELRPPTPKEAQYSQASTPQSFEARRLFADAAVATRRFEFRRAAELLQRSLDVEPDHPRVLIMLAEVWDSLGHTHRAREAARAAFAASGNLARHQQMVIEARYRLFERDWSRAEALYQALWEFFPDEPQFGLGVLEARDHAGSLDGALEALKTLRARFPGDNPRFELAESMIAYHQGDYARSQETAARAARIGIELGSKSLEARALTQESLTRSVTDADLTTVEAMLERAAVLFEELGDEGYLARVRMYQGDCARRRDLFPKAEAFYHQAIDRLAAIGSARDLDRARTSMALLLDRRGQLRQGLALKQQVFQSYRQRRVVQGAAIMQENVAISLLKMGRPAEALRELTEVEQRYAELGDQIGIAWSPYYQGRAWLDRGELHLARKHLHRAASIAASSDEGSAGDLLGAVDFERARLAWTSGHIEQAKKLAEPLVSRYQALEKPFDVAEIRLLLAKVERRSGDLDRAQELASAALEHFEQAGIEHETLAARATLAEIALDRVRASDLPEVDAESRVPACARLRAIDREIDHRRIALLASVTVARCLWREDARPSDELLDRVVEQAIELELFLPELQATLLRAQILAAGGQQSEAEAALDDVRARALDRGFKIGDVNG